MTTVIIKTPNKTHPSLRSLFRPALSSHPSSASLVSATSPILRLVAVGVPNIRSLIGMSAAFSRVVKGLKVGHVAVAAMSLELVGCTSRAGITDAGIVHSKAFFVFATVFEMG